MTIVTSPMSVIRPLASFGRNAEMSGMTGPGGTSRWTVICWPIRVSLSVTPVGSTYVITRSPFVNVSPLCVQVAGRREVRRRLAEHVHRREDLRS